jgi:catechol 2,3-dioxygenase-like lactoylglutathione lyase family enzyme
VHRDRAQIGSSGAVGVVAVADVLAPASALQQDFGDASDQGREATVSMPEARYDGIATWYEEFARATATMGLLCRGTCLLLEQRTRTGPLRAGGLRRVRPDRKDFGTSVWEDELEPQELTFVVYARDFDRSVAFYADTLELRRLEAWDRDDSQGARFAAGHDAVIEVYGAPGGGIDDGTRVAGVSLGLKVDDVDGWHMRFQARGIECTDPEDQWWGGRLFYVFDPNGLSVLVSESKDH